MTYEAPCAAADLAPPLDAARPVSREEQAALDELVEVLSLHPRGLRRWSVMRAIRASRARRGRDIPQKFEDEMERLFRRYCVGGEVRPGPACAALFCKPKETAGEVWALLPAPAAGATPSA
jgi:hypothetical protein